MTDFIFILGYLDIEEDLICIRFCDNGRGMSQEKINKLMVSLEDNTNETEHIGLRNVYKRLKIAFGKNSRIEIVSNAPEPGVSISLVFGKVLDLSRFKKNSDWLLGQTYENN